MNTIDIDEMIDSSYGISPQWPDEGDVDELYRDRDGFRLQLKGKNGVYVQELARLGEGAFLLASADTTHPAAFHRQFIEHGDWVHIQFRLNGGGRERISESHDIETPDNCCTVTRYPDDAVIDRWTDPSASWRAVCLLMRPEALTELMDVDVARFPASASWLASGGSLDFRAQQLPMQPGFVVAAKEVLACSFYGGTRHAYFRAKSLELLSGVIEAMQAANSGAQGVHVKLSSADIRKIQWSKEIVDIELESVLTLAQLARRIGVNRTKLALGFKQLYGTPLQSYWRDLKLMHAYELIAAGESNITAVALRLGYSELSSFTRAFVRKFHILPRDCKALYP